MHGHFENRYYLKTYNVAYFSKGKKYSKIDLLVTICCIYKITSLLAIVFTVFIKELVIFGTYI